MFIICGHCGERIPVIVNNWRILSEKNIEGKNNRLSDGIELGNMMGASFDSQIHFRILPAPSIYRCRYCGFEKTYTNNEITFR